MMFGGTDRPGWDQQSIYTPDTIQVSICRLLIYRLCGVIYTQDMYRVALYFRGAWFSSVFPKS